MSTIEDLLHRLTTQLGLDGPTLLAYIHASFQSLLEPIWLLKNSLVGLPAPCHMSHELQRTRLPLSFFGESILFVKDFEVLSSSKSETSLVVMRVPLCLHLPCTHSVVFKTGSQNVLPSCVLHEFKKIERQGFKVEYYNDERAERFLRDIFHPDVVEAFRVLKAGAFKADLLRFCLLYYFGGVYGDLKQKLLVPLRQFLSPITLVEDWVEDSLTAVQISFMSFPRRNILCERQIRRVVKNVRSRFYGAHALSVTGPICFGMVLAEETGKKMTFHLRNTPNQTIAMGSVPVVMTRRLYVPSLLSGRYVAVWKERDLYRSTAYRWSLHDGESLLRE